MEVQELQKNVEAIGKALEEFKATHSQSFKDGDVLLQQKMDKIADDIGKRLEIVQKHNDEMAAKISRVVTSEKKDDPVAEIKEALEFKRTCLIVQKRLNADDEVQPNIDEFRLYQKTLNGYLRRGELRMTEPNVKAMSVGSDPDGGYSVTPQMSNRIVTMVYESSPMRQYATVENISTDQLEMAVDIDEAGCGWVGERETRSETDTPEMAKRVITAHEMYAEPRATQKLLEDSAVNIERWLGDKVGSKFSRTEATAFFSGTGVGQPRGILTYPAGTSWQQIEQINSGAAATFTGDGFIDTVASVKETYLPGSRWFMRRASLGAVMKLKANNEYIWNMVFQGGFAFNILGYPVSFANDMQAIGADALAAAFGNWALAYTIVDRVGISVLRDPFTTKGFVKFYTRKRVGGDVTNFEAFKIVKCHT